MIVVYANFEFANTDPAGFEEWYRPLADQVREEMGCVRFELLSDPAAPNRSAFFEVWASREDLDKHAVHPAHTGMIKGGTDKFGWSDFHIDVWNEAGDPVSYSRQSLLEPDRA